LARLASIVSRAALALVVEDLLFEPVVALRVLLHLAKVILDLHSPLRRRRERGALGEGELPFTLGHDHPVG